MRDKLNEPRDMKHKQHEYVVEYYLYDIALSLREWLAAVNQPLDLTPGESWPVQMGTQCACGGGILDSEHVCLAPDYKLPIFESMPGSSPIPVSEAIKQLGYESPEELRKLREQESWDEHSLDGGPEDLLDDPRVRRELNVQIATGLTQEKIIENLEEHIKRLEKSNQALGEELHRCKTGGEIKGWD